MDELVFRLLTISQITSFSKEDIYLQLLSHADFPSIRAITDTLDYFEIENIAANVPKDALSQLPKLFLALVEKEGETELVLVKQLQKRVQIRTIQNKKQQLSIQEFSSQWTGTIIAIEQEEKTTVSVFKLPDFTPIALVSTFVFAVVTALLFIPSITYIIYVFLTLVGGFVSYLVSKESIGVKDAITSKVCNALSSKIDSCRTVITSKEGRVNKEFGLGDASLIYFTSLFFTIVFLGVHTSILLAISIGSLPIVVYSIYLQKTHIKQWCGLCLLTSVVLISQFGTLLGMFSGWDFSLSYAFKLLVLSMTLAFLWGYIKPVLVKNQELLIAKKDYFSFKRNETFFTAALQEDIVANMKVLPKKAQLYFGNREAAVQITAYSNPLCGYCVAAFELYDRLLTQFPKDVGIQLIFNTPNDPKNPSTQIAKQVLDIYHKDSRKGFEALKDWFIDRDVQRWQEFYGYGNSMLLMDDRILEMHRDVAIQNNIHYTPETLIENQKFPKQYYEYEDLLLFIEAIKESPNLKTKQSVETL